MYADGNSFYDIKVFVVTYFLTLVKLVSHHYICSDIDIVL